jgi:hypothetical protein
MSTFRGAEIDTSISEFHGVHMWSISVLCSGSSGFKSCPVQANYVFCYFPQTLQQGDGKINDDHFFLCSLQILLHFQNWCSVVKWKQRGELISSVSNSRKVRLTSNNSWLDQHLSVNYFGP